MEVFLMEDKKEEKVDVKNNEDVLEDIEEIEEIEEIPKEDGKASEVEAVSNEETSISNQSVLKDDSKDNNEDANNIIDDETKINEDNPSLSTIKKDGKKVPIIVLLSILLIIDIASLVIYLIGIEKVISFIK